MCMCVCVRVCMCLCVCVCVQGLQAHYTFAVRNNIMKQIRR